MESLIGAVIFIVVVILSMASKAQEARKIAERQREMKNRAPQPVDEKTRRQIHGRSQPKTATAREGHSPPPLPPARPARKPRPVEQELLETLFGVKLSREDETEREPARQPQLREATQELVQRLRGEAPRAEQPRPARPRQAAATVAADADEGPTVTAADIRKKEQEFEKRMRVFRANLHKSVQKGLSGAVKTDDEEGPRRAPAPKPKPAAKPTARRSKRGPLLSDLFATPEDLRRAVVASEVLGPPKALRSGAPSA